MVQVSKRKTFPASKKDCKTLIHLIFAIFSQFQANLAISGELSEDFFLVF